MEAVLLAKGMADPLAGGKDATQRESPTWFRRSSYHHKGHAGGRNGSLNLLGCRQAVPSSIQEILQTRFVNRGQLAVHQINFAGVVVHANYPVAFRGHAGGQGRSQLAQTDDTYTLVQAFSSVFFHAVRSCVKKRRLSPSSDRACPTDTQDTQRDYK
jgi:hypothetical protein